MTSVTTEVTQREHPIWLTLNQQALQWLLKLEKLKLVSSFSHQLQRFAQQQTSKQGFQNQQSNNDIHHKVSHTIGSSLVDTNYNLYTNNKRKFYNQIHNMEDYELRQVNY